ncbi:MAG TPA: site-specific DNA-methyltransferase [Phycisphaerales bacterium]|nr:site-specific DNA-methyltransferase [Phycisphaerales bacterium]
MTPPTAIDTPRAVPARRVKPKPPVNPATAMVPAAMATPPKPDFEARDPDARVYVGDCRGILSRLAEVRESRVDLVFADPPFNWNRAYDRWHDAMPEGEYLDFTYHWLSLCARALRPGGSLWVNIPDDWAAEIVAYLKGRIRHERHGLEAPLVMENWCIWHYRFGQNTTSRFINSKVHALHFVKPGAQHTWNPGEVLEMSDRAAIYADPRTQSKKDGMPAGMRVPMDVWYGRYWGRIQGNNKERRHGHDNQLPEVYLERVVRATSKEGDLVLDPFLGSGTTGVVARALKRRFIGCEFSIDNAERAFERVLKGPQRPLGQARGVSTAIFPKRRAGAGGAAARKPRRKRGA